MLNHYFTQNYPIAAQWSWRISPSNIDADFSCSACLSESKKTGVDPMKAAQEHALVLSAAPHIERAWVSQPGFINITFSSEWLMEAALDLYKTSALHLYQTEEAPLPSKRYLLEYVSANPTGPLHLGHARQAVIGDVLANVIQDAGHCVVREYYYNDEGNQIHMLGCSIQAHMKSLEQGVPIVTEEGANGIYYDAKWYHGSYIRELAASALHLEILSDNLQGIKEFGVATLLAEQQATLAKANIVFDNMALESELHANGTVKFVLDTWLKNGHSYEQDGAVYFKATSFGAERDVVAVKSDGTPTYFVTDVAYHSKKLERNFDVLTNIQGNDHQDTKHRVLWGLKALGLPTHSIEYLLHSMVQVTHHGKQQRPSKRAGNYITFDDLLDDVGVDALRFALLSTANEKELRIEIAQLQSEGMENPVYYVQMAHARICTLMRKKYQSIPSMSAGVLPREAKPLVLALLQWPDIQEQIVSTYSVHVLYHYTLHLAKLTHHLYAQLPTDELSTEQRDSMGTLWFLTATRLQRICALLGVEAPISMSHDNVESPSPN